jgi:hypothetical protein
MASGEIFPLNVASEHFFVKMWLAYETEFETPGLRQAPIFGHGYEPCRIQKVLGT